MQGLRILAIAAAAAAPAFADEPPPVDVAAAPPGAVPDLAPLALGALGAAVRRGDVVYAAPVTGGVVVIDVHDPSSPRVLRRLLEDRAVSRLLVDGDHLVVVALQEQALSLSLADPVAPTLALPTLMPSMGLVIAPPAPAAPSGPAAATAAPIAARGHVVDVTGGRVVFDGGATAGFVVGQRVRVTAQRLVEKPDLEAGGKKRAPSGETTAVVDVEEVEHDRAMAKLGRGDVAAPGDVVEATDAPLSERLFLPPRAPFTWRTGFHARPFFGLSTSGFPVGALVDGYVVWTPRDIPLAVLVETSPAGFAFFSSDTHYPIALAAGVTYVTDWFDVGLGGGALIGAEGPCFDGEPGDAFICEQNTGATFNQFLRLGALDGVHLQWESSIFARSGGFVLGTGRGELAVPVSSRVGLYGGGGVGENGWAFGEIGVRSMFGGTGGPGTTILSASLGGAGVFDGRGEKHTDAGNPGYVYYTQDVVSGPAVGFGMEWRL